MSTLSTELEALSNHILFQFHDEIDRARKNSFKNKTTWNFELPSNIDDTTKAPRWATIIALGPDVMDDFHVGQVVLIDALKWTRAVMYKGGEFSRTDDRQILAIDVDS